jgi:hypothetical protein
VIERLDTRDVPIAELTPFPGNARRGNLPKIRQSLMRLGQYRSVVVRVTDGALVILAGNHTVKALGQLADRPPTLASLLAALPPGERAEREPTAVALLDQLGRRVARCELIRCTDDEALRINLADNKISDDATDDRDALLELLDGLDGDYDATGWDEAEVAALLTPSGDPVPGDAPVDDLPQAYGVIVTCDDEAQQAELLGQLDAEGYKVRALMA